MMRQCSPWHLEVKNIHQISRCDVMLQIRPCSVQTAKVEALAPGCQHWPRQDVLVLHCTCRHPGKLILSRFSGRLPRITSRATSPFSRLIRPWLLQMHSARFSTFSEGGKIFEAPWANRSPVMKHTLFPRHTKSVAAHWCVVFTLCCH